MRKSPTASQRVYLDPGAPHRAAGRPRGYLRRFPLPQRHPHRRDRDGRTKVNRCLTEGRQALAGIQGGIECAKLAPRLSALADGEASAEDLPLLRPHMKTCLACRARLKAFREAPARVAGLVPPAALVAGDGGLRGVLESMLGAAQHKAAVFGERAQTAAELVSAQKVAAVAASAAALAGGGTAVDQFGNHRGPPQAAPAEQVEAKPVNEEAPVEPDSAPAPVVEQPPAAPAPEPPPPPPPPPDPATEFAPAATAASPEPAQPAPTQPAPTAAQPQGAAGGEFAP